MSNNPFDKLDAAMDAFEQKKTDDKIAANSKQAATEQFVADFSNFRVLTAHPVLEEIGNRMKERGHDFSVEMGERDGGLSVKQPTITLHVYPSTSDPAARLYGARHDHPQFTIIGDPRNLKVYLHGVVAYPTGGSMSGGRGECTLPEATANFIRDKAVDCIAESFRPRS